MPPAEAEIQLIDMIARERDQTRIMGPMPPRLRNVKKKKIPLFLSEIFDIHQYY